MSDEDLHKFWKERKNYFFCQVCMQSDFLFEDYKKAKLLRYSACFHLECFGCMLKKFREKKKIVCHRCKTSSYSKEKFVRQIRKNLPFLVLSVLQDENYVSDSGNVSE